MRMQSRGLRASKCAPKLSQNEPLPLLQLVRLTSNSAFAKMIDSPRIYGFSTLAAPGSQSAKGLFARMLTHFSTRRPPPRAYYSLFSSPLHTRARPRITSSS